MNQMIPYWALDSLASGPNVDTDHRRTANRNGLLSERSDRRRVGVIVAPMIPPARHGGRKRSVNVREVLNGISTCCGPGAMVLLPKDLPPKSTVHDYLEL